MQRQVGAGCAALHEGQRLQRVTQRHQEDHAFQEDLADIDLCQPRVAGADDGGAISARAAATHSAVRRAAANHFQRHDAGERPLELVGVHAKDVHAQLREPSGQLGSAPDAATAGGPVSIRYLA